MEPYKIYPSEVDIDTFDFYQWMVGNGPQDGEYNLKYFDQRNNVESNVTLFDCSRIKYNRPNSSFKNFLDVTIDSLAYDTYRINIHNPTIYDIDMGDLDVYLSKDGQIINGYVSTAYYIIDDKKLIKEPRKSKLNSKKSISIEYTINREDIITLQNNAGYDSGVL
jgi:hypothetical protein